ncbi:MAG: redox-regulated ATPase YchF [Oscillospiraceae bacterium]|nr:redox-regulated ATPase YchF [Oscillospiraceae bacterium]
MKLGIVGMPNTGKTTLFNVVTNAGAQSAKHAFSTLERNVGVAAVPDARLDALAALYHPKKVTPATIDFVDIAGLVRGSSRGEGLGNKFLAYIREVDAVIHVVRCFEDDDVLHVEGSIDPARDIETIGLELIFADMEMLERRIERGAKQVKVIGKSAAAELDLCRRLYAHLEEGLPARTFACSEDEQAVLNEIALLTSKPVIYVCNFGEGDFAGGSIEEHPRYRAVEEIARREHAELLPICAELEAQVAELPPEERAMFLAEIGVESGGLDLLVQRSYALLGLMSFLTAGAPEVRAWTIKRGTKAPQAAGKIHSDLERGFIRAEVISFDELMACGGMAAAKEKGLVRSEGKGYVMQDGDVVLFRFNV